MSDQELQMYRHNQNIAQQQSQGQQNKIVNCFTNYGITTCY